MADRRPARRPAPAPNPFAPADAEPPGVPFEFSEPTATTFTPRRRRKAGWGTYALWPALFGVIAAIGYGGWSALRPAAAQRSLALQTPGDQSLDEEQTLAFRVGVAGEGVAPEELSFSLIDPPEGAVIDPRSGELAWTPSEAQGPGRYALTVRVTAAGVPPLSDERRIGVSVDEVAQPPRIAPIDEREIDGRSSVSLVVEASDPDLPARAPVLRLEPGGPEGATLDPATGRFEWTPRDAAPGLYSFTVVAEESGPDGLSATQTLRFRIAEPTYPRGSVEAVAQALRKAGLGVATADGTPPPAFRGTARRLKADDEVVVFVSFASPAEFDAATAQMPSDPTQILGTDVPSRPVRVYRGESLVALYAGDDAPVLDTLAANYGPPLATIAPPPAPEAPPPTPEDVKTLLALWEKKTLFNVRQYPAVRKVFADRFEQEFRDQIRAAFGDSDMQAWLDARTDIKEELYTAIDPRHDDVVAALRLFKELKEEFPAKIEPYAGLAIAVAVTWDRERRGVYEYDHHASRTGSNYGGELLDAAGNFRFFVEAESAMQGRAQFLPWEFLVHLVNHRTPAAERTWALQGYGGRRAMFGRCYSDVPYDDEMLRTESRVCKLGGKDYVLPNILQHGGVCAMQADYAARVGKSLGVPAEYVRGESIYGGLHAWVMWIELKSVTRSAISFTLESHGRYRGDKYYVGELEDPRTGEEITDRQLELRLQTVGINPVAARQARLIMKAYPLLRDAAAMDTGEQIVFLNDVIGLSPGNEDAWRALAAIPGGGRIVAEHRRVMQTSFDRLFRTFAAFPDFTWEVFDDLVRIVDDPRQRNGLYERLVSLYEAAGRPDLACEARLRLTKYLLEQDKPREAIDGLAYTIKKFPDEGRYVPRLLDELESICARFEGSGEQLVRFYTEFLPAVPRIRGDRPSEYCLEMYERAVALFRKNGKPQLADALSAEVAKIRARQAQ